MSHNGDAEERKASVTLTEHHALKLILVGASDAIDADEKEPMYPSLSGQDRAAIRALAWRIVGGIGALRDDRDKLLNLAEKEDW